MTRKMVSTVAVSVLLATASCKNEAGKITEEDMKTAQADKALDGKFPKIKFDKTEHDFGNITDGDVAETEFVVTNTGDIDLVIADAKGSCGCTVPNPPKDPIKPGESAPIKVSFNSSGKTGNQTKTVTLTTNTEAGNEIFTVKANVQPKK